MAIYNPENKPTESEGGKNKVYSRRQLLHIIPEINCYRAYYLQIHAGLFHYILTRGWGRIGYDMRIREEFYDTEAAAFVAADRIYRQKIKKGYTEVESILDFPKVKVTQRRQLAKKRMAEETSLFG